MSEAYGKTLHLEAVWNPSRKCLDKNGVGKARRAVRRWAIGAMLAVLVGLVGGPAAAASKYDWNAIGIEFCKATLTGDITAVAPLLTNSLLRDIDFAMAAGSAEMPPARVLFQTYTTEVPVCEVQTRNAALVEIRRSDPARANLTWSEYLVIVPEMDGGSRIDDVLFATRKSDTLRARLAAFAR